MCLWLCICMCVCVYEEKIKNDDERSRSDCEIETSIWLLPFLRLMLFAEITKWLKLMMCFFRSLFCSDFETLDSECFSRLCTYICLCAHVVVSLTGFVSDYCFFSCRHHFFFISAFFQTAYGTAIISNSRQLNFLSSFKITIKITVYSHVFLILMVMFLPLN